MFQFLIGRLKTLLHSINQIPKKMFQFLIGRLKTDLSATVSNVYEGFNSL